ncbi:nicotinate (nicotinamide) nucleotide adenylyltransferase [Borreliella lusitaniae]|uniref:Probable nicotinate-nucleotide adenylyltransferase n=1 Tax=Borreliella lusitaniae TaxID=100177 RepID=A0ABZ0CIA1_9SPIR|nr:nicotinate (nicotinamide) nucleotide adenylyltransferase [Borreliella lusitaniae]WKC85668.1 nicotinate (nicotinamide) nucleotide adenylyltransferase [Borreliella lusitaniae]WNY68956.1 nicotinate (nicotinamide) nucleotide adenylyltransferase [Borreliella lusitaniae]
MRIAILGGTYNPVHIGHIFLAKEIECLLNIDKIIFIPTCNPAHKLIGENISVKNRIDMLKLALENENKMFIDDCDIINGGITYTVDTISCVKKKYKNDKLFLVIGDDLFQNFDSWKDPQSIASSVDIVVAHRIYKERLKSSFKHTYIDNKIIPISSSEIRNRIANGLPVSYLLPFGVLKYIKDNYLYVKKVNV